MASSLTGRLAPSPTGRLHLGHARSLLAAYWSARSDGGKLALRIEDLDESRSREEYVEGILEDLAWLGIDWDGPLVRSSSRSSAHRAALDKLQASGLAYPCVCTRKDIERALAAPHASDGVSRYPGTCRGQFPDGEAAWRATGKEPAWRFDTRGLAGSVTSIVHWTDGLLGEQTIDVERTVGDFVIWTKAGSAAYQMAVVVDDDDQEVNQVVRGADLVESTAQQCLLMEALGIERPTWMHLGLVLDAKGQRLAKRQGGHSIANQRAGGIPAESVVAWAAKTLGLPSAHGLAHSYIDAWKWDRVPLAEVCAPAE